jgi:putative transposase
LFEDALSDGLVAEIRGYLQQQKALGTDRFRAWVEARTGRFAAARPLGRPPRRPHCP